MNRKAYVRTLEAFLAFFITFVFVVLIVNKGELTKPLNNELNILSSLNERDDFRYCIYTSNTSCIDNLVSPLMPSRYDFNMSIDKPLFFNTQKDIRTETLFIASNQTSSYHSVYLYYWRSN